MARWVILVALGALSIVLGFVALLNPFAATLAATTLAAWFFLVVGLLLLVAAFRADEHVPGRIWTGLTGFFGVLAASSSSSIPSREWSRSPWWWR